MGLCYYFATLLIIFIPILPNLLATPSRGGRNHDALDGYLLAFELRKMADEELGLRDAEILFSSANYRRSLIDWTKIRNEVAGDLGSRAESFKEAIKRQKISIEQEQKPSDNSPVIRCCDFDPTINGYSSNSSGIEGDAHLQTACVYAPLYSNTSLSTDNFRNAAMDGRTLVPGLLRQYAATEDGVKITYPAESTQECYKSDPRTSIWYASTYSPTGKDIVLILDENVKDIYQSVQIVFRSLSLNDKVALVLLQSPDSGFHGCLSNDNGLVPASASYTERILSSLVNRLSSSGSNRRSYYLESLNKAFEMLSDVNGETETIRSKIIMVFSNATSSTDETPEEIIRVVRQQISEHPSGVIILTYVFGPVPNQGIKTVLNAIAKDSSLINSNFSLKRGSYFQVSSPEEVSSTVGTYFSNLGHTNTVADISKTSFLVRHVPQLGHVLTYCLPIYETSGSFRGATCGDVDLSHYLFNITHFIHGIGAYAFLIESSGLTISHPLLPKFGDMTENFLDISLFEQGEEINKIITSMKRGYSGHQTLQISHMRSFRGLPGYQIGMKRVIAHYSWTKVPHTDFSLCVVSTVQDVALQMENDEMENINYLHPLNVKNEPYLCSNQRKLATLDSSTVSLGPDAFYEKPSNMKKETEALEFTAYFRQGIKSKHTPFRKEVREEVRISGDLDAIWKEHKPTRVNVLWRYFISKHGIVRTYPGVATHPTTFAPPWYSEALSRPGILTLTNGGSYENGPTLILSRAIHDTRLEQSPQFEGSIVGVLAGEVRSDSLIRAYIFDHFQDCKEDDKICLLVDGSGYVILHPWRDLVSDNNNHLIAMESDIARYLINKGALVRYTCLDVSRSRIAYNWKLAIDKERDGFGEAVSELISVPGTNVYLLKINASFNFYNINPCRSCQAGESEVTCQVTGQFSCECPCFSTLDPLCPESQTTMASSSLCPVHQNPHGFLETKDDVGSYKPCFILMQEGSKLNISTSYVQSDPLASSRKLLVALYIAVAVISLLTLIIGVRCIFRNKTRMKKKCRRFQSTAGSEWVVSWNSDPNEDHERHLTARDDVFDQLYDISHESVRTSRRSEPLNDSIRTDNSHVALREGSVSGDSGQDLQFDYGACRVENKGVGDPTGEGTSQANNSTPSSSIKL